MFTEDCPVVRLERTVTSDHGTEGRLIAPGFSCFTLELPWRDNRPSVSCIPPGEYPCRIRRSRRFGQVYWVMEVAGRSWVLIHSGNLAGDVTKGLKSHVEGCILLGKAMGVLEGQRAVLSSRLAVRRFMACMAGRPFKLIVQGGTDA
ncbi:MAG: DUF5675 family protein [Desulfovibrionaceae bacterium]